MEGLENKSFSTIHYNINNIRVKHTHDVFHEQLQNFLSLSHVLSCPFFLDSRSVGKGDRDGHVSMPRGDTDTTSKKKATWQFTLSPSD